MDDGHSDGHKEQTLKYKNLSGKSELEKYNVANISKRNIFVLGLSVDEYVFFSFFPSSSDFQWGCTVAAVKQQRLLGFRKKTYTKYSE